MYILAFDTTAAQCSIIIQKDNQILSRYNEYMDFGQSEVLLPQIEKMLKEQSLQFSDINLLLVCVGPGSFTGVRASVAAARMFPFACPKLLVGGISAFDAYIKGFSAEELGEINAVIIETKREDFYVQLYDKNLHKIESASAMSYADLVNALRYKKVSLIGDGVERFLSRPSGLSLHCIKMPDALPIELLVECGLQQYQDKKLDFPKPLYIRAPDVTLPKA